MGAQLWHQRAPWYEDPEEALRALQARFLKEHYHLQTLLPKELEAARESVTCCRAEGDPYGLMDFYTKKVRLVEQFLSRPVPEDPLAQIEILRELFAGYGQGLGNVLDVKRVSRNRELFAAQQLTSSEIIRLVGVERPNVVHAKRAILKINEELNRSECVCFPVYSGPISGGTDNKEPIGWYFVGNTAD